MRFLLAVVLMGLPIVAHAQDSCALQSSGKHLAGAAKTSFMRSCKSRVETTCGEQADARKLYGAARTSNVNKCVRDGVGD